jgi:hypothetical protein
MEIAYSEKVGEFLKSLENRSSNKAYLLHAVVKKTMSLPYTDILCARKMMKNLE